MVVETIATAPGFREVIFNFFWYVVEFVYMIAVIIYVGYTIDFPRGFASRGRVVGEEVPAAAVGNSWQMASSFLKDASVAARSLKDSLTAPAEEASKDAPKETTKASTNATAKK